ncbi:hypothetical protein Vadar_007625 [Vaccinium darrowii]|uniref:Uncharacterized protein n=1 Tax=Vaccinium darrowii TaxID=229202 RepID=A0ACB7XNY8_9ERIC|nr:hypothetical protein Vadar_007625 [Vaccinium darrowii]
MKRTSLVVGFELRTNKFRKVPIPQGKKEKPVLCLGALDGSLALWTDRRSGSEVEVFLMKKYGDQASWTSLFVISTVEHLFGWRIWVPLCFTKNGEVILQSEMPHTGRISVYNPEFNSFQHIQIAANNMGVRCQKHHYFLLPNAATFIESLVSPPNNNWEEEEEYTEIFLSGVTKKWKREPGDVAFKVIDF